MYINYSWYSACSSNNQTYPRVTGVVESDIQKVMEKSRIDNDSEADYEAAIANSLADGGPAKTKAGSVSLSDEVQVNFKVTLPSLTHFNDDD